MYLTYNLTMPPRPKPPENPPKDSLSVELGGWFKAHATGAGVIAIPVIILVVTVAALARLWAA